MKHHGAFERLVVIDFQLTCRTGLHIGAGKSADLAGSELPVVRDASGRPFIPGSSLRGVLRSAIESVSAVFKSPAAGALAPDASEQERRFHKGWSSLDLVQRLFGTVADQPRGFSYASRLQISDCVCADGGDVAVELRDGVAIDRETRTAATGAKFDLEAIPAGTCFRGRVRLKNPEDYEVGLVAQALWMLDEGLILLGGKTARGLGWMKVETGSPRELNLEKILARERGQEVEYGTVEQRLALYLRALESLRRSP